MLEVLSSVEVSAILNSTAEVNGLAELGNISTVTHSYLSGPHTRFPIMCAQHYRTELLHAMYLVLQYPPQPGADMNSLVYLRTKVMITLLEASSTADLQSLQARILLAYYELAHGLMSAAAISVAACAREARSLHLSPQHHESADSKAVEEERRTWWAIYNLDRYIGLATGDATFTMLDPKNGDWFPCYDGDFLQDRPGRCPIVGSTQDATFGQFARESQISHLASKVVRHVFDPAPDEEFHQEEAKQLERTLMYFLPLLESKHLRVGRYCTSLSIVASALFLFLDRRNPDFPGRKPPSDEALAAMAPIALLISDYAARCFASESDFDYVTLSPYSMLSLYQAAAVHTYIVRRQADALKHEQARLLLQHVLRNFGKRWTGAAYYLRALENEEISLLPQSSRS